MWIIVKSAGDDYSFTEYFVDAPVGHSYQYASELAEKVTKAMKAYVENELKSYPKTESNNCVCSNYRLENYGCTCGAGNSK